MCVNTFLTAHWLMSNATVIGHLRSTSF